MTAPQPIAGFDAERHTIEAELEKMLAGGRGGRVLDAMRYSVLGGGKRIRPLLALRIAEACGGVSQCTIRAAAAVEMLHCASLVIDDLPSMDDARTRRGRDCVHIVYGEATATLAAFGLVALAARSVIEIPCAPAESERLIAFQLALLRTLDVDGLIEGQAQDLSLAGSDDRLAVNELKTVPLFDLAGAAGALFAPARRVEQARRFGRAFGRAFQLADDLLDGDGADYDAVAARIEHARSRSRPLGERRAGIDELLDLLHASIAEKSPCHR